MSSCRLVCLGNQREAPEGGLREQALPAPLKASIPHAQFGEAHFSTHLLPQRFWFFTWTPGSLMSAGYVCIWKPQCMRDRASKICGFLWDGSNDYTEHRAPSIRRTFSTQLTISLLWFISKTLYQAHVFLLLPPILQGILNLLLKWSLPGHSTYHIALNSTQNKASHWDPPKDRGHIVSHSCQLLWASHIVRSTNGRLCLALYNE